MRAPTARIRLTISSWRGRSRITTIRSRGRTRLAPGDGLQRLLDRRVQVELVVDVGRRRPASPCRRTGPGSNIVPRSDDGHHGERVGLPARAQRRCPPADRPRRPPPRPVPSPIRSPLNSIGASSFSPSPITTTPSISTVSSMWRMASTAAWSAAILSPAPTQRDARQRRRLGDADELEREVPVGGVRHRLPRIPPSTRGAAASRAPRCARGRAAAPASAAGSPRRRSERPPARP